MKKIKAVAFDMDGTLFSSDNILEKVYALSVEILNKNHNLKIVAPKQSAISPQLGKPNHEIYKILFPHLDSKLFSELKELNGKHFSTIIKSEGGTIFDGTQELLLDLKNQNIMRFIASNGSIGYVTSIIDKYSLPFSEPYITLDYSTRFVKADILGAYLLDNALSAQEMIMVGDRIMDLEAAKAHGVPFIGIKEKSFGDVKELAGSDYIVNSLKEAHQLLRDLIKN